MDILACESRLRVPAAQHTELLASQFVPPLLLGFLDLGCRGGLRGLRSAHLVLSPGCGHLVLDLTSSGMSSGMWA
jgi:hypothetical protein